MSLCYASLILTILVSLTANAFPVSSPLDLVEYCYYDTAEWLVHQDSICHEISNQTTALSLPLKMLLTMQASYANYARNEKHDRELVLNCFMQYRLLDQNSFCWKFSNQSNGQLSRRELNARAYFDELRQFQGKVNDCAFYADNMLPLPSNCAFLDDMELVEHCFLYHQFSHYMPCQNISWPKIAAPTDARSMFLYSAWMNVSADIEYQIEEFRMGMEGIPDPMAIVMECLYKNDWLKDPNSICHDIAESKSGHSNKLENTELGIKYYFRKLADEDKDCLVYHKDGKFPQCEENLEHQRRLETNYFDDQNYFTQVYDDDGEDYGYGDEEDNSEYEDYD